MLTGYVDDITKLLFTIPKDAMQEKSSDSDIFRWEINHWKLAAQEESMKPQRRVNLVTSHRWELQAQNLKCHQQSVFSKTHTSDLFKEKDLFLAFYRPIGVEKVIQREKIGASFSFQWHFKCVSNIQYTCMISNLFQIYSVIWRVVTNRFC